VSGGPAFRADLYRGTAAYYDRYRLRYPDALIETLCARTSAYGGGRLLDLACGPGTVTFALSTHFAEVWAVDQEPETVEFAAGKAARLGVHNVRWVVGRAEDVDHDATFDVVTIGTAFHRLDRRRVADLARHWLRPGGYLALLWSDTALNGTTDWQRVLAQVVVDWMRRTEAEDRLPADLEEHLAGLPHTQVLADAGFVIAGRYEFVQIHDWSVEELIGLVYSTSLLPHSFLGDRADAFESDVRERLRAVEPAGVFREQASFAYDLASPAPSR
jgi:ubiquinone/menaquinone biosynthesis C-methylase UbiE